VAIQLTFFKVMTEVTSKMLWWSETCITQ